MHNLIKLSRIPSYEWKVGTQYFLEVGNWSGLAFYIGSFPCGRRIRHVFSEFYGCNQYDFIDTKEHFKVYKFMLGEVALLDNGNTTCSNE